LSAIQPQPAQAAPSTWTPTGDLNTRRIWRTATLLPDGKVLAAVGPDGAPVADNRVVLDGEVEVP